MLTLGCLFSVGEAMLLSGDLEWPELETQILSNLWIVLGTIGTLSVLLSEFQTQLWLRIPKQRRTGVQV